MRFNEFIPEAGSPAQQAAIAINMKKHHQKPKSEGVAEGEMNFEEGDCPVFAIALHRLSKLPLMALVEYDEQMGSAVLIHAYVKLNNKWRIDATGEIDVDWMLQKYPNNGNAEEIEISEKDLIKLGYGKNKCPMLQQVLPHAKEVLQTIDNEQGVAEGENWSKHNNKRVGGMSKKSVSSYRRSHPGSKIQTAVTTKPSKIKKGSKDSKRRASFCARMKGMKKHNTSAKTAHDPDSNINKSLRRWHCESIEQLHELVMIAEQFVQQNRKIR
jgi:hypothetical protein